MTKRIGTGKGEQKRYNMSSFPARKMNSTPTSHSALSKAHLQKERSYTTGKFFTISTVFKLTLMTRPIKSLYLEACFVKGTPQRRCYRRSHDIPRLLVFWMKRRVQRLRCFQNTSPRTIRIIHNPTPSDLLTDDDSNICTKEFEKRHAC